MAVTCCSHTQYSIRFCKTLPACVFSDEQLLIYLFLFIQYRTNDSHQKEEEPEEHVYEVEANSKEEDLYQNPDQDDQYQASGNLQKHLQDTRDL